MGQANAALWVSVLLAAAIFFYYALRLRQMAKQNGGDLTGPGWEAAREIIYRCLDSVVGILAARGDGEDGIVEAAVNAVYKEIQASNLPTADILFWDKDHIKSFVSPVVKSMLAQINKRLNI